jgi:hypothetical protein
MQLIPLLQQPSLEVIQNITTLLRLLLTQEVTGIDRIMLIDQLEQILQGLMTGQTINVEYDTEDNGERILTITTTSTLAETGITEEEEDQPEQEEDSSMKVQTTTGISSIDGISYIPD